MNARKAFRKSASKFASDELGLGGDQAEQFVDIVEKEADTLSAAMALNSGGGVDKSAASEDDDALTRYLYKRAGDMSKMAKSGSFDKSAAGSIMNLLKRLGIKGLRAKNAIGGAASGAMSSGAGLMDDAARLGQRAGIKGLRGKQAIGNLLSSAKGKATGMLDDVTTAYSGAGEGLSNLAGTKGIGLANKLPGGLQGKAMGLLNRATPGRMTKALYGATALPPAAMGALAYKMSGDDPAEASEEELAEAGNALLESAGERGVGAGIGGAAGAGIGHLLGNTGLGAGGGALAGLAAPEIMDLIGGGEEA